MRRKHIICWVRAVAGMRSSRTEGSSVDRAAPALRFGVRAMLAAGALILVTVPFGVLLLLVRTNWAPLRQADLASSADLHRYAVTHPGFVTAMRTLSVIGSSWTWIPVFVLVGLVASLASATETRDLRGRHGSPGVR